MMHYVIDFLKAISPRQLFAFSPSKHLLEEQSGNSRERKVRKATAPPAVSLTAVVSLGINSQGESWGGGTYRCFVFLSFFQGRAGSFKGAILPSARVGVLVSQAGASRSKGVSTPFSPTRYSELRLPRGKGFGHEA